jgi:hypothetical protein
VQPAARRLLDESAPITRSTLSLVSAELTREVIRYGAADSCSSETCTVWSGLADIPGEPSMTRTVSTQEAIRAVDTLLNAPDEADDVTIVERVGDPIAVIMRPDAYNQLVEAQVKRDWAIIDRLRERNRDKDPEQVERDIEEAIAEVRLERRRARKQTI